MHVDPLSPTGKCICVDLYRRRTSLFCFFFLAPLLIQNPLYTSAVCSVTVVSAGCGSLPALGSFFLDSCFRGAGVPFLVQTVCCFSLVLRGSKEFSLFFCLRVCSSLLDRLSSLPISLPLRLHHAYASSCTGEERKPRGMLSLTVTLSLTSL